MKISIGNISVILILIALAVWPASKARAETAAELIEQARQCDPTYVIGPTVNRAKALELYEEALAAQPDQQQRLHVLFRIGQLHGSILDRHKGEKPDFRKAIGAYRQIVDSYPPGEPLVMTAMGLISDHYAGLAEPEAALHWAKKALEYDIAQTQAQIKTIEQQLDSLARQEYTPDQRRAILDQRRRRIILQENLDGIDQDRLTAVDRVANAAELMHPLRAHGELRAIADRHAGTPIGDRAAQRLQESMDRSPDLWAPNAGPLGGPSAAWEPASKAAAAIDRDQNNLGTLSDVSVTIPTRPTAPEPNTTERPKNTGTPTESARAPPWVLLSAGMVAAAGLIALGLVSRRTKRRAL